jgi:hypothetical protein
MVKLQLTIAFCLLVLCSANAEARGGRRMAQQYNSMPYYNYNVQPAMAAPVVVQPVATVQAATAASGVVQTSATAPASAATPSNGVTQASATGPAPVVATIVVGSAQWKAEQSARIGSVQHLGGGFGGGSHEGNGFGATREQAIQNCCFWGQLTPIDIGAARGANGWYATVFYR